MIATTDYWHEIARHWRLIKPPLRPDERDLAIYQLLVAKCAPSRPLLLGVTPEIARLDWAGATLTAVDHTEAMIDALWPNPRENALLGEWTCLPPQAGEPDFIICDGGLHLIDFAGQASLAAHLMERLAKGGMLVMRLFSLSAGEMPFPEPSDCSGFSEYKLRVTMLVGGYLSRAYDYLVDRPGGLEGLAEETGWALEEILACGNYRESSQRYSFTTLSDTLRLMESVSFELVEIFPEDSLCPIVAWRKA